MQMVITIVIIVAASIGLVRVVLGKKKRSDNCSSSICNSCSQSDTCALKNITRQQSKKES